MDLVGPVPKSPESHKHILVMVDNIIHYPDAFPLWKATSRNVTKELVLLFSHMGLLKDLLSDQYKPFVM